MNRSRSNDQQPDHYRTVTEILDTDNVYQKEFDIAEYEYKNEAYLRKNSKRQLYLMVAKYFIEVVKELNVPDVRILFDSNENDKIFTFVYYSLAFVNNQMLPHNKQFIDMKFVRVTDRKMSIPTDPIVFYKSMDSDDQTITCFVDTVNIHRILSKYVDVESRFEPDDSKKEVFKLIDRIKRVEQKKCEVLGRVVYVDGKQQQTPTMDEVYVQPFVALLIIFSNAYLGLFKLLRSDFQQYYHYLLDHEGLLKERSLPNIGNIIMGHFSFQVDGADKRQGVGLNFKV
ncbi:ODV-E27 [Erinnyis ello granulovirus]|uniref:ODV-E27 n=1 Tax=Erinnyis ello granulovirus TaxID=307444 RepID=A0A097DAS7_9BBAC|nr:ODV-E27 [Erinnyis ello granulovirus]AIS92088.1 ODV-E27 [Erinnyis ello granulovirus]ARX71428.1 odv-e27 [Erinnyis ello granulovirus]ARX71558.1 odv-e27 [Erinnyis ello granulovirus]ARX71688.1 odv-e27 [Erinnyis ello granulovirus]ARX71818.1 odv-e27 [Erinnyis ello granulovirus]